MNIDMTVIRLKEFYLSIPFKIGDTTNAGAIAEALRGVADRIQEQGIGHGFSGYVLDADRAIMGVWGFN